MRKYFSQVALALLLLVGVTFAQTHHSNKKILFHKAIGVLPDSLIMVNPDTTITGFSANIVKRYSLNDPAVMWDRDAFQAKVSVSSIGTRGDTTDAWPTNFAIVSAQESATDSLGIINTDTGEQWMWFVAGASYMLGNGASAVFANSVFLDGVLYVAVDGTGLFVIDFLRETSDYVLDQNSYRFKGNISERNTGAGIIQYAKYPPITNADVNVVDAIRDPEGGMDEFGRPLHYWVVGTDGGISEYNPIDNAIWDSGGTDDGDIVRLMDRGDVWWAYEDPTRYWVYRTAPIQSHYKNGFGPPGGGEYADAGVGGTDIPWTTSAVVTSFTVPVGSVTHDGAPVVIIGSDEGLMISQNKPFVLPSGSANSSLTHTIDATQNAPLWSGVVVDSYPLEDATGMFGEDLTDEGVTFSSAVIGNGVVLDGTNIMYRNNDATYTPTGTMGTDLYMTVAFWVKSSYADSWDPLLALTEGTTPGNDWFSIFPWAGVVYVRITSNANSTAETVDTQIDVLDNTWHHIAFTIGATELRCYLDGILIDTDASLTSFSGVPAWDTFTVGDLHDGFTGAGSMFIGTLDQILLTYRELTAKEVRHLHQRGRDALQHNAIGDDALVGASVQDVEAAEDGSIWVLAGASTSADSTLHRLTPTGIPTDTLTASGLVDIDVWNVNGAKPDSSIESYGVAMALGTGGLRLIQPNPVVADRWAGYNKSGVHGAWYGGGIAAWARYQLNGTARVDSAGAYGSYYNVQDALDAGGANVRVDVGVGTYPPFDYSADGQQVWGVSWGAVIDGANTDDAVEFGGVYDNCVLANITAKTTSSGPGYDAVDLSQSGSEYFLAWRVRVPDSDNYGFNISVSCPYIRIIDCHVDDADVFGIYIAGSAYFMIKGNHIGTSGGGPPNEGIYIDHTAANGFVSENNVVMAGSPEIHILGNKIGVSDNWVDGTITLHTNSNDCLTSGNIVNTSITNSGTSNTVGDVEVF